MLSKYYYTDNNSVNSNKVDINLFVSTLFDNLREKYEDVRLERIIPIGGGTLGIFFELYIKGKRKFVKTHQCGMEYRDNISKEVEILSFVYRDVIEIEKVDIEINGKRLMFMIMDYLFPCEHSIEPDEVRKYISFYQNMLIQKNIEVKYSFQQILDVGEESLEVLYLQEFLPKAMYIRCKESLQRIKEKKFSTIICHGDLSNVNIMYTEKKVPIVIDWEDSLLAFKEYDYLYWLTFFSQRRYYAAGLLESKGIDRVWGIDVMVLIIIIKSKMSFQNGSYKNNTISFQDRINEIFNIIE